MRRAILLGSVLLVVLTPALELSFLLFSIKVQTRVVLQPRVFWAVVLVCLLFIYVNLGSKYLVRKVTEREPAEEPDFEFAMYSPRSPWPGLLLLLTSLSLIALVGLAVTGVLGVTLSGQLDQYVQPLLHRGTIVNYTKGIVIAVLAIVLLVVVPHSVASRVRHEVLWLPLPVIRFFVRSALTLVDLVLVAVGLYAGYWLRLFPRTAATDAFVAWVGLASLKIAASGLVVFVTGVIGGVGSALGIHVTNAAIKAHSRSPDNVQQ